MKTEIRFFNLLLAFFLTTSLIGQSKQLKKAAKKYPDQHGVYQATFKKAESESEINRWCKNNGYQLISVQKEKIARRGNVSYGIAGARFMEKSKYNALVRSQSKSSLSSPSSSSSSSRRAGEAVGIGLGVAIIGGLGYAAYKGIQSVFSGSSSGYSDYSDSSSKKTPCYSDIEISNSEWDSECYNGKTTLYKVKCNGSNSLYYYCSGSFFSSKGYYEYLIGADRFLGNDKGDALKKLCECN